MNNLEYLRTLDAGEIANVLTICPCEHCAYDILYCDRYRESCAPGIESWLLQEHVVPDSWEKLLADLDDAIFGYSAVASYAEKACIPKDRPTNDVFANIAARIRALRGGE